MHDEAVPPPAERTKQKRAKTALDMERLAFKEFTNRANSHSILCQVNVGFESWLIKPAKGDYCLRGADNGVKFNVEIMSESV